jgi:hypothetical protein
VFWLGRLYVYDAFPLVALDICCFDEPYISLMLNLILLSLTQYCRELRIPLSCSFVEFDGETYQEVITS